MGSGIEFSCIRTFSVKPEFLVFKVRNNTVDYSVAGIFWEKPLHLCGAEQRIKCYIVYIVYAQICIHE